MRCESSSTGLQNTLVTGSRRALALSYLPGKFTTTMCSEADGAVRELLRATHEFIGQPLDAERISFDMCDRRQMSGTHLYIGTSPCQDFSSAGTGRGQDLGLAL